MLFLGSSDEREARREVGGVYVNVHGWNSFQQFEWPVILWSDYWSVFNIFQRENHGVCCYSNLLWKLLYFSLSPTHTFFWFCCLCWKAISRQIDITYLWWENKQDCSSWHEFHFFPPLDSHHHLVKVIRLRYYSWFAG